jgi:hypothetical protein
MPLSNVFTIIVVDIFPVDIVHEPGYAEQSTGTGDTTVLDLLNTNPE